MAVRRGIAFVEHVVWDAAEREQGGMEFKKHDVYICGLAAIHPGTPWGAFRRGIVEICDETRRFFKLSRNF